LKMSLTTLFICFQPLRTSMFYLYARSFSMSTVSMTWKYFHFLTNIHS
jgi:hypothetical protein